MAGMRYAVVSFTNDDTIGDEEIASELPLSWLSNNRQKCWWPKVKNVNTLIMRSVLPEKADPKWELHDVELQGFYETLEIARKRAENIYTSSDEKEKSCRHRRKKVVKDVSSVDHSVFSDSDQENSILTKVPEFPTVVRSEKVACLTTSDQESLEPVVIERVPSAQSSSFRSEQMKKYTSLPATENTSSTSNDLVETLPRKESTLISTDVKRNQIDSMKKNNSRIRDNSAANGSLSDFLLDDIPIIFNQDPGLHVTFMKTMEDNFHKAFIALADLSIEMTSLAERLSKIEQLMTKTNATPDPEIFVELSASFPFKTKEDILSFEFSLTEKPDLMDKVIKYLSQIGGNTAKENIIRILRRVFTNSVAQKSSWLGLRNNFKISNLKIILAIRGAVTSRIAFSDKDFEEIVSEWLRQAKQRLVREEKRVQNM